MSNGFFAQSSFSRMFASVPRSYKIILSLAALCLLVVALGYLIARTGKAVPTAQAVSKAEAVRTAEVVPPAEVAQTVSLDGMVKPFKSVVISASLREVIRKIEVSEGDRIKEGQVLVRLESEKQRLAVSRYELLIAKATFDQKAAQSLFEQNVSSRDDALDKEIDLKRLQVEHGIAKEELAAREIKSPLNGVVVRKFKEPGESVSEVEPILEIMENDRLLLSFYLDANMLASVKMGQEVDTRYPELSSGALRKAAVVFIDPEVDSRSGLFRVRLLLDNKDESIKPGMRVQAEFPVLAAGKTGLIQ